MDGNVNIINWFEVSVADINRAKKFYETVFNIQMAGPMDMMGMAMVFFPSVPGNGKVSGALAQGPMHQPSSAGVKVYFNGNPDLADALSRVEAAGGRIDMPKTKIGGDNGFMAFFTDTEGNSIGLHSQN